MSVWMSLCMRVMLLLQFASSFLFLDGIDPFLGHQFFMWHSTKLFSSWFRSHNAQNLIPKICICTKLPISRLVWQIDRRCLGLLGVSWGWPIQWNHAKCCGADPCCHGNKIWANFNYFSTKSPISSLVCQRDRIWGDDQGPIFVAMATT